MGIWATASSSGPDTNKLILLKHSTLAGADFQMTGITGYKYLVLMFHVTSSQASGDALYLRFNADGGANYDHKKIGAAYATQNVAGATALVVGGTLQTNTSYGGMLIIAVNPQSSSNNHSVSGGPSGGYTDEDMFCGTWKNASAITQVDLFSSAGVLTGEVSLFGVKTA